MRRTAVPAFLVVAVVSLVVLGRVAGTGAQDATGLAGHPLVGAWVLDTDVADPTNGPTLATFSADGVYTQVETDGSAGIGVWQATGPQTADMMFHGLNPDEDGGGWFTVRAAIEVAADGQSLTASYTLEIVAADGTASGQYGPGEVTGTRIAVEPMGTPVGTLDDLFGEEGGGEDVPSTEQGDVGTVSVAAWSCSADVAPDQTDPAALAAACTEPATATFSLSPEDNSITRRRPVSAGQPAVWPAVQGAFILRQDDPAVDNALVVCGSSSSTVVAEAPDGVFRGEVAPGEDLHCDWYAFGTAGAAPVPASPVAEDGAGLGIDIVTIVDAADGVTPVGGACVEITGAGGAYQVCDDAEGDADLSPGSVEVDAVVAGDYVVAVEPPPGHEPSPEQPVFVAADSVTAIVFAV